MLIVRPQAYEGLVYFKMNPNEPKFRTKMKPGQLIKARGFIDFTNINGIIPIKAKMFKLNTPARRFKFKAPTEAERDEWVKCINNWIPHTNKVLTNVVINFIHPIFGGGSSEEDDEWVDETKEDIEAITTPRLEEPTLDLEPKKEKTVIPFADTTQDIPITASAQEKPSTEDMDAGLISNAVNNNNSDSL